MMKLQIVSDLHLEFNQTLELRNTENADVLILAGDVCVASYLKKSEASPYHKKGLVFKDFFTQIAGEYDRILYVMGNHEHYQGTFEKTANILREVLPDNIQLLDNDIISYRGYNFLGGTMWSDLSNPIDAMIVEGGMNDFHIIKRDKHRMRATQTTRDHFRFRDFLRANAALENKIVISHHAPHALSIAPQYQNDKYNPGYYSDMHDLILDLKPRLWFHGHMHWAQDYEVGETRVICNPYAYPQEYPGHDRAKAKIIELP